MLDNYLSIASQRFLCLINKRYLEKGLFLRKLHYQLYSSVGRCSTTGNKILNNRFKGNKKKYRILDNFFLKNIPFQIESQEYDPNRSSFINLIFYKNGVYSYILSTYGTYLGNNYICTNKFIHDLENGNRCLIINMPLGSLISNISLYNNIKDSKYIKSAGTFGIIINKENNSIEVRLPSFRLRKKQKKNILKSTLFCNNLSYGTLGRISNIYHNQIILGKAGRSYYLGNRPSVRGVAMNPVDHPHGGGEGKKSKKSTPVNSTGTILKHSRRFKRKKN